jgi:hypothetical protein
MEKPDGIGDDLGAHPSRIASSALCEPTVSFTEFMPGFNHVTREMEIEPNLVNAPSRPQAPATLDLAYDLRASLRDHWETKVSGSVSEISTSTGMTLAPAPRLPQVRVSPDGQWQVAHSSLSQDPVGGVESAS